jgi:4-amino-4-deoxy-L-arabinose transferase-like glycosyltransferase
LLAVLAALLLLVLLNLLTASRFPAVGMDEVMFADPAANYLEGNGLTSTAWRFVKAHEIWAGNAPLHTWLLVPWIKLFGFTLTSVRAVNFIYIGIAAFLLWVAVRRLGLISSPCLRVTFAVLVPLEYAVMLCYRSGRYDSLGILLTAAVFAAATLQSQAARMALVAAIGVLVPITGLHLIPYAVAIGGVLLLFFGNQTLQITIPLGVGIATGGALLYVVLQAVGAWHGFVTSVFLQRASYEIPANIMLASIIEDPARLYLQDPSLIPSFIVLVIGLATSRATGPRTWRRIDVVAVVLCFVVPLFVGFSVHFGPYYTWMVSVPALVGAVAVWDRLRNSPSKRLPSPNITIGILLAVAGMVGLPARLGVTALRWPRCDYTPVQTLVSRYVRAGDIVFGDWPAFYALHHVRAQTFYPGYDISPSEKASINLMIISPQWLPEASDLIGGNWHEIGAMQPVESGRWAQIYNLSVFSRESK